MQYHLPAYHLPTGPTYTHIIPIPPMRFKKVDAIAFLQEFLAPEPQKPMLGEMVPLSNLASARHAKTFS